MKTKHPKPRAVELPQRTPDVKEARAAAGTVIEELRAKLIGRIGFGITPATQDFFRQTPDLRWAMIEAYQLTQPEIDYILASPMGSSIFEKEDFPRLYGDPSIRRVEMVAEKQSSAKLYARNNPVAPTGEVEEEIVRPGRPRKGKAGRRPTKLRRLQIMLSEQTLNRLETLRQITKTPSLVGVIRDAVRVYEASLTHTAAKGSKR